MVLVHGSASSPPAAGRSYFQLMNGGGGGMAGGPVQEKKARPGGPVKNIFEKGGGEGGIWLLFPVRKGHIGVFTPSLRRRYYLPVNKALHHKTHILFHWR